MRLFYQWVGIGLNGKKMQGKLSADSSVQLRQLLKNQGISVVKIKRSYSLMGKKKISVKDIIGLTTKLASLCHAHLSLVQGLEIISKQDQMGKFHTMISLIQKNIEQGMTFSEALMKFPEYFDSMYIGLVQAGEQSGTLTQMLIQLANYQENMTKLKSKLAKAMYYPAAIVVVAALITSGLLIFVVPQFQNIFANFGAQLPIFTLGVIHISQWFRIHFITLILVAGSIFFLIKILKKKSKTFNSWTEKISLHCPIIGRLIQNSIIARWAKVLATTLSAGIPLVEALRSASNSINHSIYQHAFEQLVTEINAGSNFHQALQRQLLFPQEIIQMVWVGENSGQLITMLEKIAENQQNALDQTIDYFSKWLEPAMMMVISILTGGLIIAMYLPVFRLGAAL